MVIQMKQEKIIAGADILATQMNHWTLFSIVSTAAVLGKEEPPFVLWAVCALLPIFFFLIRRYTNQFLIMAGSHLLCLMLLLSVPISGLALKTLVSLYGIGLTIYSFSLRLRTEERLDGAISPPAAVGIIALSLFLLHYMEHHEADSYYIGMTVFYFICYYIRCYFQHYLYFLTVNAGSAGYIPRREIFLSGSKLSAAFTLSGMAAVLFVSDWNWLTWILGLLKQGIVWVLKHFHFTFTESLSSWEPEQPPAQVDVFRDAADSSGSAFWQILEIIIAVLTVLALFLLFCLFLFRFIQMMIERFRQKKHFRREEDADSVRDIREKYEIKKEKKPKKSFFAFLNAAERIRRIYKQRIWSQRESLLKKGKKTLLNTYTARECGGLLHEEPLSLVYEKARYSNEECTREDVKRAKAQAQQPALQEFTS